MRILLQTIISLLQGFISENIPCPLLERGGYHWISLLFVRGGRGC